MTTYLTKYERPTWLIIEDSRTLRNYFWCHKSIKKQKDTLVCDVSSVVIHTLLLPEYICIRMEPFSITNKKDVKLYKDYCCKIKTKKLQDFHNYYEQEKRKKRGSLVVGKSYVLDYKLCIERYKNQLT